jgi:hypothetical protein
MDKYSENIQWLSKSSFSAARTRHHYRRAHAARGATFDEEEAATP